MNDVPFKTGSPNSPSGVDYLDLNTWCGGPPPQDYPMGSLENTLENVENNSGIEQPLVQTQPPSPFLLPSSPRTPLSLSAQPRFLSASSPMTAQESLIQSWSQTPQQQPQQQPEQEQQEEAASEASAEEHYSRPWTAAEVQTARHWFRVLGHDWLAMSRLVGVQRRPEELYALYKHTAGFTRISDVVAPVSRPFCCHCYEDSNFDQMLSCPDCPSWYHPTCGRVAGTTQLRCPKCDKSAVSPVAETTLLRTSARDSFVYLCCHRDCVPCPRFRRYFLHGDGRGPHYGVDARSRPNLRRHMQDSHDISRTVSFDTLLCNGLVRRVPLTRVTNAQSTELPEQLHAAPSPPRTATTPAVPEPLPTAEDPFHFFFGDSPFSPYQGPPLEDAHPLLAPSPPQPVPSFLPPLPPPPPPTFALRLSGRQKPAECEGRDPPLGWLEHVAPEECPPHLATKMGDAAVAMRESLAKFRWGTRCTRCTALETPLAAAASTATDVLLPPEPAYTPVLPHSDIVEALCKRLCAAESMFMLLKTAEAEAPGAYRDFIVQLRAIIRWQLRDCVGGGGLVPFGRAAPRCWVLSMAVPLVDVAATVVPGRVLTCPDSGYGEVRAGDTVFFWGDVFYPEQVLPSTLSDSAAPPAADEAGVAGVVGFGRVLQGPRLVPEFGVVRRHHGDAKTEENGEEGEEEHEEDRQDEHSIANRLTVRVDTRYARPLGLAALAKSPALSRKQLSSAPGLCLIPLRDSQAAALHALLAKSGAAPHSSSSSTPEHEAALEPGACVVCHAACVPGVPCQGHCGQVVHAECLPRVAPEPAESACPAWRCADCLDAGADTRTCAGCHRACAQHDTRHVTCDACCAWYHPACARSRVPTCSARLWLCHRCLLSPVHAARCELYLLSAELAHQTVHILASLARSLPPHIPIASQTIDSLRDIFVEAIRGQLQDAVRDTVSFYADINRRRINEEENCWTPFYTRDVTQRTKRARSSLPIPQAAAAAAAAAAGTEAPPRRHSAPPTTKRVKRN